MNKKTRDYITHNLLTVQEAVEYTGLKEEAIQARIWRGKLDAVMKARTYLIYKGDLKAKGE